MSYSAMYNASCGSYLIFSDPYQRHLKVEFYAFINEMSQTFSLTYDTEDVYGRNDSIFSYKNTKRSISLNWSVPSETLGEAKANRLRTRMLIRMLYPTYENIKKVSMKEAEIEKLNKQYPDIGAELTPGVTTTQADYQVFKNYVDSRSQTLPFGYDLQNSPNKEATAFRDKGFHHTQTMIENPIVMIKYANLLSDPSSGLGLLGYLDGLSVKPVIEEGYFTECAGETLNILTGKKESHPAGTYPKLYSLSCNFNVLHQQALGYENGHFLSNRIFQWM